MKTRAATFLLIGWLVGVVSMLAISGRYQWRTQKDVVYPMRLDRWTGRSEYELPSVSKELRAAWEYKPSQPIDFVPDKPYEVLPPSSPAAIAAAQPARQ